jgi:hypothetical protein
MTETETKTAIEESKTTSRTARFAEWLMAREERRQEKESNLEGLMKLNFLVSTATLIAVAGASTLNYLMVAWAWI